jgi:hypothetical protein
LNSLQICPMIILSFFTRSLNYAFKAFKSAKEDSTCHAACAGT